MGVDGFMAISAAATAAAAAAAATADADCSGETYMFLKS